MRRLFRKKVVEVIELERAAVKDRRILDSRFEEGTAIPVAIGAILMHRGKLSEIHGITSTGIYRPVDVIVVVQQVMKLIGKGDKAVEMYIKS